MFLFIWPHGLLCLVMQNVLWILTVLVKYMLNDLIDDNMGFWLVRLLYCNYACCFVFSEISLPPPPPHTLPTHPDWTQCLAEQSLMHWLLTEVLALTKAWVKNVHTMIIIEIFGF